MNQNVNTGILSCWGGSIHTADGANAQDTLQVSSYPFLALLTVQPSSSSSSSSSSRNNNNTNQLQEKKLELHLRMEGTELQNISPDTLHNHLSNTLGGYQQILSEQAMRRLVRQQESDLIQQQNDEYEAALAADRAREREREEERQRLEEERQKVEQEEMIQRQKLEQEERTQRQILQNAKDLLAKGEPSQNEANCATIRLTLPNGKRVARRFRATDTIHVVRAFLTVYFEENGVDIQNFSLNSNYPKKALVHVDATVESEGLCPQAVIMVQDLDA